MEDNRSSKTCKKDHIIGHTKRGMEFLSQWQKTKATGNGGCGNYKTIHLGYAENDAGYHTIDHPEFRNLYVEELKYNKALLEEFKTYLRSKKVSGKFALINGYLDFHWGSGRAHVVEDCHFKPSSSKNNFQLLIHQCHEYGKI